MISYGVFKLIFVCLWSKYHSFLDPRISIYCDFFRFNLVCVYAGKKSDFFFLQECLFIHLDFIGFFFLWDEIFFDFCVFMVTNLVFYWNFYLILDWFLCVYAPKFDFFLKKIWLIVFILWWKIRLLCSKNLH